MTCPVCKSIASYHDALAKAPTCDPKYAFQVMAIGAIIMIHCDGYDICESCSEVYADIRRAHMAITPESYDETN